MDKYFLADANSAVSRLAIGLVIYFSYGHKHSVIARKAGFKWELLAWSEFRRITKKKKGWPYIGQPSPVFQPIS